MQKGIAQSILGALNAAGLSEELRGVFLIGSQARGDARAYSDIDVLALTHERHGTLHLYPARELTTVSMQPLGEYLANLYAPEDRQAVIDWFLVAGNAEIAQPWLDPGSILPVARRVIQQRLQVIQFHRRIYWEEQLNLLTDWRLKLSAATPLSHDFYWALARFLDRATDTLVLYNGRVMPRHQLSDLRRPDEFDDWYSRLWLMGSTPSQTDTGRVAETIARVTKGLWRAVSDSYAGAYGLAAYEARQQSIDRIPGQADEMQLSQTATEAILQHIDDYLVVLWSAVKHMLTREPVQLIRQASILMEHLYRDELSAHPHIAPLLDGVRVPEGANPKVVPYLAEEMDKALRKMNNRGA